MGKFSNKSWRDVFKVTRDITEKELKVQYMRKIKKYSPLSHPEEYQELKNLYEAAKSSLFYQYGKDAYNPYGESQLNNDTLSSTQTHSNHQMDYNGFQKSQQKLSIKLGKRAVYQHVIASIKAKKEIDIQLLSNFFAESYNIYIEMAEFQMVFGSRLDNEEVGLLLKNEGNPRVYKAWNALLHSTLSYRRKNNYLDGFTEIEREYFENQDKEKLALFIAIVNTRGFTYPYNYLTQDIFYFLKASYPDVFKKYIKSVDVRLLTYYNDMEFNLAIMEELDESDRATFYKYALIASNNKTRLSTAYKTFCDIYGRYENIEKEISTEDNSFDLEATASIVSQIKVDEITHSNEQPTGGSNFGLLLLFAMIFFIIFFIMNVGSDSYEPDISKIEEVRENFNTNTITQENILSTPIDTDTLFCLNIHEDVQLSATAEDDGNYTIVIVTIKGATTLYSLDKLYLESYPLEDISTHKVKEEEIAGGMSVEFTYERTGDLSDSPSIYYYINPDEYNRCIIK